MSTRLKTFCLIWSVCLLTQFAFSQVVVGSGVQLVTTNSTQISLNNSLTVNSDQADLSKATLILTGADQNLTNGRASAPIVIGGLLVGASSSGGGGTKSILGGAWEVAGSITFNSGVVVPQTSSNGKLVHTVANGTPGDVVVNNVDSYVNGTFYSKGTGIRVFPIGNSSGYFPSQLSSVTQGDIEIGMRVLAANAALTHGTEILDIFKDRHWEVIDPTQTLAGPIVALSSLSAQSFIDPTIGTVVVGAPAKSGAGVSLGGSQSGDFIVGSTAIKTTERIFTLGKISSDQVKVKIHNVITPFLDNANDYLQIENIDIFPENKVTLLDRWGVKVKEWSGYSNVSGSPDPGYDLSKIATGNYICIVEYKDGSAVKKLSQMITLINQ